MRSKCQRSSATPEGEPNPGVVADSGPLIALARISMLDLLESLYGRVLVPAAVWAEVTQGDAEGRAGAAEIRAALWIEPRDVDPLSAEGYSLLVDRGEAEAIALAQRIPDGLLLIDDDRGRRLALRLGLRVKGTLGVLLSAKRHGRLPAVRPPLEGLLSAGIHGSRTLIAATLREAGE